MDSERKKNRTMTTETNSGPTVEMTLEALSGPFHKYGGIRPPMHPVPLRCSSVAYSRYSPSSRLAGRAPRRPRCVTVFMKWTT